MSALLDCAVCGGALEKELLLITEPDRFEKYLGIPDAGYWRKWVACKECGAATNVYQEGVLQKLETLASGYYEVDFKSSTIKDKYELVMSLPSSHSDNAQRVERIKHFLSNFRTRHNVKTAKVLDIGAGTGVFLSKFLQQTTLDGQRWQATAVEPDDVAASHLRSLDQFDVIHSIFDSQLNLKGFQLCTLNKVLEHLADPIQLLKAVATALDPESGVLYVEVPSVETIDLRPANDNILGPLHRHLYDIQSLNKAITSAGLTVIEINRLFEPSGKISISAFAVSPEAINTLSRRASFD